MNTWATEDVQAHINFQVALNERLTYSGELVDVGALEASELAGIVTFDGRGASVVTGGPSAAPGPGGTPIKHEIEVRALLDVFSAENDPWSR